MRYVLTAIGGATALAIFLFQGIGFETKAKYNQIVSNYEQLQVAICVDKAKSTTDDIRAEVFSKDGYVKTNAARSAGWSMLPTGRHMSNALIRRCLAEMSKAE
jgi:hypothetical protein